MTADFESFSFSPENFSAAVRLFPLPNLVLFPQVMQPLHVFEPRYRDLLEEALADDKLIAMATLLPGWEKDYEGRPPLAPVACLGRVVTHHRLEGGQYNILLLGLCRVRLIGELPPTKSFREANVEICHDHCPPAETTMGHTLQQKLREAFLRVLPSLPQAEDHLDHLLNSDAPLGTLTDIISYMLDLPLEQKMALLAEENVDRRAELLLEHLSDAAADSASDSSGAVAFPPQFSPN